MSAQNLFISGKDLSALSSITQEDLMQAINQLALLDNVGVVIVSTTRPDITSNPYMIRSIWLDISNPANPSFKRYIGDRTTLQDADAYWAALGVTDLAILTSMMAARSASGGINVGLLKLNSDYSATPASAYYVLRVAANGKDIEVVGVNQAIVDGGKLALSSIDTTGLAVGKFLGYNGGVWGAVPIVPSTDLIGAAKIAAQTNMLGGSARQVLRSNSDATPIPEWKDPNDIFNDGELTLARISGSGGAAYYGLRRNAANNGNEWGQTVKVFQSADTVLTNATKILDVAHGLGGTPDGYAMYLKCTTANGDYVIDDVVDALEADTGSGLAAFSVAFSAGGNAIVIQTNSGSGVNIRKRTTATVGDQFAITLGSWRLVLKAWRFNL